MLQIKTYKKQDGNTYYKFQTYLGIDSSGKPVRVRRSGFKTKTEAKQKALELKMQFEKNEYIKPTFDTFQGVYEAWLEYDYLKDEIKESTLVKTERLFKLHILKDLGKLRIAKITKRDCDRAVENWSKKHSKAKTMANYAKRVFDYAIDEELINTNPMERVKVPKNRNVKRDVAFYEKEELSEFLASASIEQNPIWFPLFHLLAYSGMRKGEALALQWKDIDFMNRHLTVSKTLTRGKNSRLYVEDSPKTQAGNRDIPLDETTLSVLKQWRKDQREMYIKLGHNTLNDSQLIFTNLNNDFMQPPALTKAMDRIVKKNDLKRITVHQLRHTHASLLFNAGASIKEVQQRLGHSSYEVTMNVYTHVTKDKQTETVDKLMQYMNL